MKRLLITILMLTSIQSFAQTFKITDVQVSDDRDYQSINKKFLNKEIKATFNDKSVTLTQGNGSTPLTLKYQSENYYSFSRKQGDVTEVWSVMFKTTFGVISSMQMTLTKRTSTYTDTIRLTGKRF